MSDIKIVGQIELNTGDAAKKIEDVKKGLNDTGDAAKKVASSNKEAGGSFSNLKESLTSISPTANAASESFGGFNNALNLIKANPIIGVLAGLAAIIIGLFSKFSKMEGVSDSLGKAWSQLSGIFSGFINKILTPLIDGFTALVDLFSNSLISILDTLGITSKDTADRMGELAESLDDLEDAQKDSAIAAAESNRKLQEARELAADANVPIKDRVKALREASKIENEELTKIVEINTTKAKLMLEQIALELNGRSELIAKIREGSLESLKAARAEMMAMKNIDKEKISGIDQMIIAAEDAAAKRSKIGTKTEKQITSLEKEEEDKRENARKDAAAKAAAARQKENDERVQREQETQRRLKEVLVAGQKAIDDALKVLRVQNRQTELAELKKKFDEDVAAANNAGFSTLRIREAFQKQQAEINFKYDEEARLKKQKDEEDNDAQVLAMQEKAVINLTNNLAQQTEIVRKAAADKIAIEEALIAQQKAMQQEVAGILQSASAIFGQQTVAGKGIAIAQALINTYSGATDALRAKSSLPSPFDVVAKVANVAAVLATGFKSIKAITSVQVPGASGGGGVSTPSIAAAAPILPQQTSTSLDSNTIQNIGNAAAGGVNRAYVVSSDIARDREREAQLNRAARL